MRRYFLLIGFVALLFSCKKEETVFTDNDVPSYNEIPTVLVQNYVNRLYIDLLGREPFDDEMSAEVELLEDNALSSESRSALVNKLMTSTTPLAGDSSYFVAYNGKLYEDMKARLIEGASEGQLQYYYFLYYNQAVADSINGNFTVYEILKAEADKVLGVMQSQYDLRNETIQIDEMARRMTFNAVYDEINMNSFNFINASFDDLYFRFPTQSEFDASFNIIEYNVPDQIFGQTAQNKPQYLDILLSNTEFDEGMIRWAFESLLNREPTSNEIFEMIGNFQDTKDFQRIQRSIMITDEYAGFD